MCKATVSLQLCIGNNELATYGTLLTERNNLLTERNRAVARVH